MKSLGVLRLAVFHDTSHLSKNNCECQARAFAAWPVLMGPSVGLLCTLPLKSRNQTVSASASSRKHSPSPRRLRRWELP